MREIGDFVKGGRTLLVIGKPSLLALDVLVSFNWYRTVYDAMDDFPSFYQGLSRLAMTRRERQLCRVVEQILVSSNALLNRFGRLGVKKLSFTPNACSSETLPLVSVNRFDKSRIVIGYVGTIGEWFDWPLVMEMARGLPTVCVRLIGPLFSSPPSGLPANVEILPPQSHDAAICSMQNFTVGLIPFKRTRLTASVDPIKYYEYRALGLPIISTSFGEMKFRAGVPGVFIVQAGADWEGVMVRALNYHSDSDAVQAFRRENTWMTRFDSSGILESMSGDN